MLTFSLPPFEVYIRTFRSYLVLYMHTSLLTDNTLRIIPLAAVTSTEDWGTSGSGCGVGVFSCWNFVFFNKDYANNGPNMWPVTCRRSEDHRVPGRCWRYGHWGQPFGLNFSFSNTTISKRITGTLKMCTLRSLVFFSRLSSHIYSHPIHRYGR